MRKSIKHINWDALGVTASIICAIHCAFLPLLLTSLPLFGIDIIDNKPFEFGMIGLACVIGIIALSKGQKHHHSYRPILIFSIGMLFLVFKEIFHEYHTLLLVPAVFFILWAHFYNYRLCAKSPAHAKQVSEVAA